MLGVVEGVLLIEIPGDAEGVTLILIKGLGEGVGTLANRTKFEVSKLTNVIISLPVVVVGVYGESLAWNTFVGNDTVPDPTVLINTHIVCPDCILEGLIYVSAPPTN